MFIRRLVPALCILTVAAVSCGGSSSDTPTNAGNSSPGASDTEQSPDATSSVGTPSASDSIPLEESDGPAASTGDGTCEVTVSGEVTDSYVGGQNIGEAYAVAWLSPDQVAAAGNGAPTFQVGCSGPNGQSVVMAVYDVDVPLGSMSVTVSSNAAGYSSTEASVGNAVPVDVTLTRFDESGMAGNVTFQGNNLGTDEASTVTMTFDFVNSLL